MQHAARARSRSNPSQLLIRQPFKWDYRRLLKFCVGGGGVVLVCSAGIFLFGRRRDLLTASRRIERSAEPRGRKVAQTPHHNSASGDDLSPLITVRLASGSVSPQLHLNQQILHLILLNKAQISPSLLNKITQIKAIHCLISGH